MRGKFCLPALLLALLVGLCGCAGFLEREITLDTAGLENISPRDGYRTFYEIFVGAFSDSDGDGMGDLQGVINRLDYLNDGDPASGKSLGVSGLWLMPVFPAGSYHKYDVWNYTDIDSDYGTLEDMDALLAACHERDIAVIVDLVLNHTSSYHPWFKAAKKAVQEGDMENPYAAYYSIGTTEKAGWYPLAVDPKGVQYYYEGNFSPEMPELNMDTPALLEEIRNIAAFWLERGVDGFRLDAVKYVYLNDDARNIAFWQWFAGMCREINPEVILVGEDWSDDSHILSYYKAIDCFDFGMAGSGGEPALTLNAVYTVNQYAVYLERYTAKITDAREGAIPRPFLSNHDMDRSAGYASVKGKEKAAANLYLLSPGSPFLYYGEEIGMLGSRGNANTDANRRLAMLWGDGDKVQDPVGSTYPASRQVNGTAAAQVRRKDSLYNHYKKLLLLRGAYPEIARGSLAALELQGYDLAGGWVCTWQGRRVAVVQNIGEETLTLSLETMGLSGATLGGFAGGSARLEGDSLTLAGQTAAVLPIP